MANIFISNLGGYHIGDEPDSRTLATLRDNGITNYQHEARKVSRRNNRSHGMRVNHV